MREENIKGYVGGIYLNATGLRIDKVKTKRAVTNHLKQYVRIKKRLSIEKAYGRLMDDHEEMQKYIDLVDSAIELLEELQKDLIVAKYIHNSGDTYDYIVKDSIQVAERTYYRIKWEAVKNLSYGLRITVYKDE